MTSETLSAVLHNWARVFAHRSMQDFKQFMLDAGLSASQVSALMHLYHAETCSVSDISERIGISRAATSQMLDKLVQMGLLARTENPADRRAKQLTLTPKGIALVEQGIEARRKWLEDVTNLLPADQQADIRAALEALTHAALQLEAQETHRKHPISSRRHI